MLQLQSTDLSRVKFAVVPTKVVFQGGSSVTKSSLGSDDVWKAAAKQPFTAVTLRAALAAADQGDRAAADLGIDLSGYNWYRDFSIGVSRNSPDQLRAFIISRASDSSIYIFDSGGKLITDAANLGEILSIELFDFDGDNRDEIITRQKTGWGTGVYREEFVIYGLKGTQALQTLWRATSYAYSDLGSEREFVPLW